MATKAKPAPKAEKAEKAAAPAAKAAAKAPKAEVVGKNELIAAMAEKTGGKRKEAAEALQMVLDTIQEHLKEGRSIRLIPFGSFEVRERKGRTGRNPRTGDQIPIEARKVPAFKPGKSLRDAVN